MKNTFALFAQFKYGFVKKTIICFISNLFIFGYTFDYACECKVCVDIFC